MISIIYFARGEINLSCSIKLIANIIPVRTIKLEEPVRKFFLILIVVIVANLFLSACASKSNDAPAKALKIISMPWSPRI